jgi:diketogulonate reductase-like aldo/keto reductase
MEIPIIGFGTYRVHDQQVFENAIINGYNAFDTGQLYKNEQLVKNAIDKCSGGKKIYITTKISKKSMLKGMIEESFYERLGIFGYIDLVLLHHPSDNCLKDWTILSELYLKNRDKVGNIGVSNYDINHMEQIKNCEIRPYCNQIELSPFYTRIDLVKYLRENDVRIVSHTTLTRSEKFDNETLIKIADKYKTSVASVLLSWALFHNYTIIPRTICDIQMVENLTNNVLLDESDIDVLDELNENFFITRV